MRNVTMRRSVWLSVALYMFGVASLLPFPVRASETLRLEENIVLGKVSGRIDHLAVGFGHRRLFVAELGNDSVRGRVYVSCGEGFIDVFASEVDAIKASSILRPFPARALRCSCRRSIDSFWRSEQPRPNRLRCG